MKRKILFSAGILLLEFSFSSCFETCEDAVSKSNKPIEINGKIDSIFLDETDRNQPCVLINKQKYLIYSSIYKEFSKGDILIKHSGSMKYYWVKGMDTTIFYQKCGGYQCKIKAVYHRVIIYCG